jgi:hypothetical protein
MMWAVNKNCNPLQSLALVIEIRLAEDTFFGAILRPVWQTASGIVQDRKEL